MSIRPKPISIMQYKQANRVNNLGINGMNVSNKKAHTTQNQLEELLKTRHTQKNNQLNATIKSQYTDSNSYYHHNFGIKPREEMVLQRNLFHDNPNVGYELNGKKNYQYSQHKSKHIYRSECDPQCDSSCSESSCEPPCCEPLCCETPCCESPCREPPCCEPPCCDKPYNTSYKCCTNTRCNIWEGYWPFSGSGEIDPGLDYQLNYNSFNNNLLEKWNTSVPTPQTNIFPVKDLFKFSLFTNKCVFDFNYQFQNLPLEGDEAIVLNINPNSVSTPFNSNQFIFIKDPNINVTNPGVSPTNVLAVMAYYNSDELYVNQFTNSVDNFDSISNLLISTQVFAMHISQTSDPVDLKVAHSTNTGENLFEIIIETNGKIEIKETIIPVAIDEPWNITILVRTVYINGKYFMTYAVYDNDIAHAIELGDTSLGYTIDSRQVPIQLVTMLLFGATTPIVDLGTTTGLTEHERMLIRLFKDFLQKNI